MKKITQEARWRHHVPEYLEKHGNVTATARRYRIKAATPRHNGKVERQNRLDLPPALGCLKCNPCLTTQPWNIKYFC